MTSDQRAYTSNQPFDPDVHLDGLLLTCGDGRFEAHVNDFREHLRKTLGLRKLDRYFVPGSQLQFVSSEAGHPPAEMATDYWTRFFIDNHFLSHVVIMGHELCAAYHSSPAYQDFDAERMRQEQEKHLRHWRDQILQRYPQLRVHLFFMKPAEGNCGMDFFAVR